MMEKKEYLTEENYNNSKRKIKRIALIVLVVGLLIGGGLISIGLIKQSKVNSKYSEENKVNIQEKLESEKKNLETKKSELELEKSNALAAEKKNLEAKKSELQSKGIKYDAFAKYDEGESYDLKIVTKALDPSFDNCAFDEYKNNSLTSKYCLLSNDGDEYSEELNVINKVLDSTFNYCAFDEYKNNVLISKYCSYAVELDEFNDFNRRFDSVGSTPFYMIGAFVIIASCMIAGSIYMISKRREILAFSVQQVMPVAQEGVEKMAPTVANVGKTIAKEMAPVYGDIAKEISKGIKEGLKDDEK